MIRYQIEKHAACFPSKCLASNYGRHIFNVQVEADTDNGFVIKRKEWKGMEYYSEDTAGNASTTGVVLEQAANGNWYVEITNESEGLLVYNVPMIAEDNFTKEFMLEGNYFNEAKSIVRAYELAKGDIIELSEAAFDGTPEAKKTLTIENKKWKVGA